MAQKFDAEFGTLIIPGAYPSIKVEAQVSGLSTTGVVAIVGEADAGAPGSQDLIENNYFGPDQEGAIRQKYVSGPIVDAFRALASPANDPGIAGSVQRIYIYKTNASGRASSTISNQGFGSFGTLSDKNWGKNGNLIYWLSQAAQSEVGPSTSAFTYIPSPSAAAGSLRSNGDAAQSFAISAKTAPSALAATLDALVGILAQGGVNRSVLSGLAGQSITAAASGNSLTLTLTPGQVFASLPVAGDTLLIAALGEYGAIADSVYSGAGSVNRGAYVVTSVSNSVASAFITATKVRNNTVGGLTPPITVAPTAISVNEDDILVYSPIAVYDATGDDRAVLTGLVSQNAAVGVSGSALTFTLAAGQLFAAIPQVGDAVHIPSGSAYQGAGSANVGEYIVTVVSNTAVSAFVTATRLSNGSPVVVGSTPIVAVSDFQVLRPAKAGLGKAIEISDAAGTDNLSLLFKQLGTTTAVTWLGSPLTSSAEYINLTSVNRQLDNIQESFQSGGTIALKVGYLGTTASLTISATSISTTVTGGTGAGFSRDLSEFPTLADLATYIGSQTGYSASLGSTLLGQKSPSQLDKGTYGICSSVAAASQPGRIKRDLADLKEKLSQSVLVNFVADAAAKGLPDPTAANSYLSGGAKGGTSGASIVAAMTALEGVSVNFIVPLFSRDYTADIAAGLTDSTSTYTIASVHASVKSHCLAMSQVKRRKNRQGFLSIQDTFINSKQAANTAASYRLSMTFLDEKALGADGNVSQKQPWYGACIAAGMQGAGFYKSITHKVQNVSGVLSAAGDYNTNTPSQVEDALLNGLLPAERAAAGIRWVSDQTTYGADANFVYNSIQAVYTADVVALSLAERMDNAFVGQTLGDVSATMAIGFIQKAMYDYLRLKLISVSDDAPLGFKNLKVQIQGGVMLVSMEIKLATAIYFIPIAFTVSQVTQTAAA